MAACYRLWIFLVALVFTAGCSSGGNAFQLQPYTVANRGTQGPPANYRSLAKITLGVSTDQGWAPVPMGPGQEKARAALFKRAASRPKNLNMGLTSGSSHLSQVIERNDFNGTFWHDSVALKGDAEPYLALVPDRSNLTGAVQGITVFPPSPSTPVIGPAKYTYTWTLPDAGLSGVMFPSQGIPRPGPLLDAVGGKVTLELIYDNLQNGSLTSITLNGQDVTQSTLNSTNVIQPAFACISSGLYRMQLSINGEEVVNETYLQRAPVLEQPLTDFSGAPINSTVHIQNRIVFDQGPPNVTFPDSASWQIVVGPNEPFSNEVRGRSPLVNSDVIDAQWNISDNQFLPLNVNRKLNEALSKQLPPAAPSAALRKDETLIHKYTINATVMVDGYRGHPYQVAQSGLVNGRWRRVSLLQGAASTQSHLVYDVIPLQFDDPVLGGWDVTLRAVNSYGNPTGPVRQFQGLGYAGGPFTIEVDWDGLDDSGVAFPPGVNVTAFVHAQVAERGTLTVADGYERLDLAGLPAAGGKSVSIQEFRVGPEPIDPTGEPGQRILKVRATLGASGFQAPAITWVLQFVRDNGKIYPEGEITGGGDQVEVSWDTAQLAQLGDTKVKVVLLANASESGGSTTGGSTGGGGGAGSDQPGVMEFRSVSVRGHQSLVVRNTAGNIAVSFGVDNSGETPNDTKQRRELLGTIQRNEPGSWTIVATGLQFSGNSTDTVYANLTSRVSGIRETVPLHRQEDGSYLGRPTLASLVAPRPSADATLAGTTAFTSRGFMVDNKVTADLARAAGDSAGSRTMDPALIRTVEDTSLSGSPIVQFFEHVLQGANTTAYPNPRVALGVMSEDIHTIHPELVEDPDYVPTTVPNFYKGGFEAVMVELSAPGLQNPLKAMVKVANPASTEVIFTHGKHYGIIHLVGADSQVRKPDIHLEDLTPIPGSVSDQVRTLIFLACSGLDLHDYNNFYSRDFIGPEDRHDSNAPLSQRNFGGARWHSEIHRPGLTLLGYAGEAPVAGAAAAMGRYQGLLLLGKSSAEAWVRANLDFSSLSYKYWLANNACAFDDDNYYFIQYPVPRISNIAADLARPISPEEQVIWRIPHYSNGTDNWATKPGDWSRPDPSTIHGEVIR